MKALDVENRRWSFFAGSETPYVIWWRVPSWEASHLLLNKPDADSMRCVKWGSSFLAKQKNLKKKFASPNSVKISTAALNIRFSTAKKFALRACLAAKIWVDIFFVVHWTIVIHDLGSYGRKTFIFSMSFQWWTIASSLRTSALNLQKHRWE